MIAPFYVGQKVICIDNTIKIKGLKPPLKKDKVYTVLQLSKCVCNAFLVDVGLPGSQTKDCIACPCGGEIYSNYWFVNAQRFRAVQELKFPLLTYSKVLEEELTSAN